MTTLVEADERLMRWRSSLVPGEGLVLVVSTLVVAGAWLVLLMSRARTMSDMATMPANEAPWVAARTEFVMAVFMVIAMMLPLSTPAVRHVARNTLRWRRRRAMLLFLVTYLSCWLPVAFLSCELQDRTLPYQTAELHALAFVGAALWQLAPMKRRALQDCHRASPLPARGQAATFGAFRFGALHAAACIRSCWLMMVAVTMPPLSAPTMAVACLVVSWERRAQRPVAASRLIALVLALAACVVLMHEVVRPAT